MVSRADSIESRVLTVSSTAMEAVAVWLIVALMLTGLEEIEFGSVVKGA